MKKVGLPEGDESLHVGCNPLAEAAEELEMRVESFSLELDDD